MDIDLRATQIFNEIMQREQERNELLKDSAYAQFALSDESATAEAMKAYQARMTRELEKKTMEMLKNG